MTNFLPAASSNAQAIENLRQAAQGVGSGGGSGGVVYLKVDDRTGALTYGPERTPLPPGHKFVIGLHSFMHGYVERVGGKPANRHLVSMSMQATRPTPAKGYAKSYGEDGFVDTTEIILNSVDEPGFDLTFTAWGAYSSNRVRNLLEATILHADQQDGRTGFKHPVIVPKSSMKSQSAFRSASGEQVPARDVHFFDYTIVDWLHDDGKTLLSKRVGGEAVEDKREQVEEQFDEDDLSEAERELMQLK